MVPTAERTLQLRDSIVVSISACHAEDPGSIPGRGTFAPSVNTEVRSLVPLDCGLRGTDKNHGCCILQQASDSDLDDPRIHNANPCPSVWTVEAS